MILLEVWSHLAPINPASMSHGGPSHSECPHRHLEGPWDWGATELIFRSVGMELEPWCACSHIALGVPLIAQEGDVGLEKREPGPS